MPTTTTVPKGLKATWPKASRRELDRMCETNEVGDALFTGISFENFYKVWDKHCKTAGEEEESVFYQTEFSLENNRRLVISTNIYTLQTEIRFKK